jgi:response regulator RpfG family c-di-GMP phosphodiesterase
VNTVDNAERSGALPLRVDLAFASDSLERGFGAHYHAAYYRYAQASLALGMVLIAADFLVDHLAFSGEPANMYRLQLCLPILAAGIAYSFSRFAARHWQTVMSGFIALAACSLFWVLLVIDRQGGMGLRSWVGVLNFVFLEFYCFVILGVQFRYALASGSLILLMFEAAMLFEFFAGRRMFYYWSYHIVTLFLLAAVVGWWREYVLRKDFSMQASLEEARNFLRRQNEVLESEVEKRTRKIQDTQNAAIVLLASIVETRDNETGNHVRRTQYYLRVLAKRLQSHPGFAGYLTEEQIEILFRSAPLHDIGKVGIPDSILRKAGKLDAEELEIMRTHAALGCTAIENAERRLGVEVEFLACAKEIALHHHEKWDGSGYPGKLAGADIPISARLMAVADVYDALTTRRVYKDPIPHAVAVAMIIEGAGSQFDPDVVAVFAAIADEFEAIGSLYPDLAELPDLRHAQSREAPAGLEQDLPGELAVRFRGSAQLLGLAEAVVRGGDTEEQLDRDRVQSVNRQVT